MPIYPIKVIAPLWCPGNQFNAFREDGCLWNIGKKQKPRASMRGILSPIHVTVAICFIWQTRMKKPVHDVTGEKK